MKFSAVMKDERGFVHKKLLSIGKRLVRTVAPAVTSFIPGGNIVQGLARGFIPGIIGGGSPVRQAPLTISTPRPTPPRTLTARVTPMSQAQKLRGQSLKFDLPSLPDIAGGIRQRLGIGNGTSVVTTGQCDDPRLIMGPNGICTFPGSPAGTPGEAQMGRFGPGLEPFFSTVTKRTCLPGMVLGKAGSQGIILCYNKKQLSNKERLWPKGTAPLLTGGEMSAIRKADRARGKIARTAKRLGIGATTRRARPRPHAHAKALRGVRSVPI